MPVITQQERLQAIERQLLRLQRRINTLDQKSNRYGWTRVGLFFAALLIGICLGFLANWWVGVIGFLVPAVIFGIFAYHQRRIDRSLVRHQIWYHIKTAEIARIHRDWNGIPDAYTPEQQIDHPFEADLDITGKHSLHRLLNTAISPEGSERLRSWLLKTRPDLPTIRARQTLVQELLPMSTFRTRLTMKATLAVQNTGARMEGQRLLQWLNEQKKPANLIPLILTSHSLTALILVLFVLNLTGLLAPYWIIAILISIIFLMATKEQRGNLFEDSYYLRDAFTQINAVFSFLETYRYGQKEHLKELCRPYFASASYSPSRLLKKVQQIASGATLERNMLFWLLLNIFIPWDFYLAWRFYHYRDQLMERLPAWLEIWCELEALSSLATFSYLHPQYIQPEITSELNEMYPEPLKACGLGHPLLQEEKKVVNDFTFEKLGEIIIITGSNMAGKSTFLRTVGINLCLAYAGGPVNATHFATGLFRIYTCIKISDSVTDGYSYFYAEVRRLHALLEELERADEPMPICFLIDEIFRGTNNRERRIGSEAYIEALANRNCLGLLSTHDLELVKLAELLPQVKNYHFKEDVIDGKMIFDYILRTGPCPTTNALKIMQMEGLPVKILSEEMP